MVAKRIVRLLSLIAAGVCSNLCFRNSEVRRGHSLVFVLRIEARVWLTPHRLFLRTHTGTKIICLNQYKYIRLIKLLKLALELELIIGVA